MVGRATNDGGTARIDFHHVAGHYPVKERLPLPQHVDARAETSHVDTRRYQRLKTVRRRSSPARPGWRTRRHAPPTREIDPADPAAAPPRLRSRHHVRGAVFIGRRDKPLGLSVTAGLRRLMSVILKRPRRRDRTAHGQGRSHASPRMKGRTSIRPPYPVHGRGRPGMLSYAEGQLQERSYFLHGGAEPSLIAIVEQAPRYDLKAERPEITPARTRGRGVRSQTPQTTTSFTGGAWQRRDGGQSTSNGDTCLGVAPTRIVSRPGLDDPFTRRDSSPSAKQQQAGGTCRRGVPPARPGVDPEQAAAKARPHFELRATASAGLVGNVVGPRTVEHRVGAVSASKWAAFSSSSTISRSSKSSPPS